MSSSSLECKICFNVFSEAHCPRILPCSHSFCGICIDGLISAQKKECSVCIMPFMGNSFEDFVINRGLLDAAAEQLSSPLAVLNTKGTRPKQPFLKTTQLFRENFTKRGIAVCQEAEAEVQGLIDRYREMEKQLQEVKVSSEKNLSSIDRNIKLLLDRLKKLQKNRTRFNESDAQLEAATDLISAAPFMQEAEELLQAMEKTLAKFQEDKKEECHIKKEILEMKENLERFLKDTGRIVTEEGALGEEGDSVVKITVSDLRSPHGRLRGDAQREIFAVMTFEGKLRLAPVKIESNNQVSFTHLEEGVLPPRCFVIELESLIPGGGSPSPPLSHPPPRGFLDLAYGPTPLGRVIIRVTVDGLLGRNFLLMCAGGMGAVSYVHSRVSCVGSMGRLGERIVMGEYQPHGGGGGGGGGGTRSTRAVLPSREEDWERERESGTYEEKPYEAGDVRGNISYEGASRFWIVTRDHPSLRDRDCFGMVEEGLDVLKSAISKYKDSHKVEVANCGLIL